MSDYEHQEGKAKLFRNDYKKEGKHPDLKGKIMVDGKMKDVAAWKDSDGGDSIFITIKPEWKG